MQPAQPPRKLHAEVLYVRLTLTTIHTDFVRKSNAVWYEDMYHSLTWPQLSYVAEDEGKVVGYILAKM